MAGHSHSANIQHRKGAQDKKKAKSFNKLLRAIEIAAKSGADQETNYKLRTSFIAAREGGVPKDKIEAAIHRASSNGAENLESLRYNGMMDGVAFVIEAFSDNKNRTANDIRTILSKNGANMVETGSVEFMFDHIGLITYPVNICDNEKMLEIVIESGGNDMYDDAEFYFIETVISDLHAVRNNLAVHFGDPKSCELIWKANVSSDIAQDQYEKVEKLVDILDDSDDVDAVYTNAKLI